MGTAVAQFVEGYRLGNACYTRGEYDPAADVYRRAIRLNPNFACAHYNLGFTLLDLKDKNAAKRKFDEAHRLDASLIPPKASSKR